VRVRTLLVISFLILVSSFASAASAQSGAQAAKPVATLSFSGSPTPVALYSFSWGVSNSGSFGGGGGGAGKATFSDFSFTKPVTGVSPLFLSACANGQHLPQMQIDMLDTRGSATARITLKDVLVSSYQTGGSGGEVTESVSLNYSKLEYEVLR
jgi:type VI protein secretion system component Hcp